MKGNSTPHPPQKMALPPPQFLWDSLKNIRLAKKKCGPPKKHYIKKKIDGVGTVDNRPYTNKLHHLVQKRMKKEEEKNVTCDT